MLTPTAGHIPEKYQYRACDTEAGTIAEQIVSST